MADVSFRQNPLYADGVPGASDRLLFETSDNLPRGVAPGNMSLAVSGGAAGLMSGADKAKLDGLDQFSVKTYGAEGDGTTDDTAAIQAAIDAAEAAGGGFVLFPPGTYIVMKVNPTNDGGASPDDMALRIDGSRIYLVGYGRGVSIIKHKVGAPARFKILGIGVLPIVNGQITIIGGGIRGLEFDSSYTPNTAVAADGRYCIWAYGIRDYTFEDLYLHHSSHYGIGLQNGGHHNVTIRNVVIEDVAGDGIDVKNNGNTGAECKMDGVTVRRFGRANNPTEPFAGIDLMGEGWVLNNIHVSEFGDAGYADAGVRFKQGEAADSRGWGAHHASMSNFHIQGESGGSMTANGIDVSARQVLLSNGHVRDCPGIGVQIGQAEAQVANVLVRGCGTGFKTEHGTGEPSDGIRALFANCIARGCTGTGFDLNDDFATLSGCISRANNIGVTFDGASNTMIGGDVSANASSEAVITGTNTIIRHVRNLADI